MRPIGFAILAALFILAGALAAAQTACSPDGCGLSASAIEANRRPNATLLPVEDRLLTARDYRKVFDNIATYSTPGGEATGKINYGFVYLSALEEIPNWVRINGGAWVKRGSISGKIKPSRFSGLLLPTDAKLPYTIAWVLQDLSGAKSPGGEEAADNPFLHRYTPVYIYDSVEVNDYSWHQIGVNQWAHQFKLAKILPVQKPAEIETRKWISVDLHEQVVIAYEGTAPVFATLISSGMDEWPTHEGLFQIYARYTLTRMTGGYLRPDYYYLQDVPWTMYFDEDIGFHGAYWHDDFGSRRSHGCVNMALTDAHWLFKWSESEYDYDAGDLTGPEVYVYSSDHNMITAESRA